MDLKDDYVFTYLFKIKKNGVIEYYISRNPSISRMCFINGVSPDCVTRGLPVLTTFL